jgi:hypothetical protein
VKTSRRMRMHAPETQSTGHASRGAGGGNDPSAQESRGRTKPHSPFQFAEHGRETKRRTLRRPIRFLQATSGNAYVRATLHEVDQRFHPPGEDDRIGIQQQDVTR